MFGYESQVTAQIGEKRAVELGWMKKRLHLGIVNSVYKSVLILSGIYVAGI